MNEFKFDDTVNKNGGFIRYPFGYEGYITIHFTSKNVDSRTDGKYEFQINFIDNNKDLSSQSPQQIKQLRLVEQKIIYENVEDV